eukprot:scaffold14090_cov31-Tisochrysis_lutea.AAC.4
MALVATPATDAFRDRQPPHEDLPASEHHCVLDWPDRLSDVKLPGAPPRVSVSESTTVAKELATRTEDSVATCALRSVLATVTVREGMVSLGAPVLGVVAALPMVPSWPSGIAAEVPPTAAGLMADAGSTDTG